MIGESSAATMFYLKNPTFNVKKLNFQKPSDVLKYKEYRVAVGIAK